MRKNEGQAIIEYILLLVTIFSIFFVLQTGFRRLVHGLWKEMACDIAAPCVMCRAPEEINGYSRFKAWACRVP